MILKKKINCFPQGLPEKVTGLHFLRESQNISKPYDRTVFLSWELPCRSNTKIDKFVVRCVVKRNQEKVLEREIIVLEGKENFTSIIHEFLPDQEYNCSVQAVSNNTEGVESFEMFKMEAGGKKKTFL